MTSNEILVNVVQGVGMDPHPAFRCQPGQCALDQDKY